MKAEMGASVTLGPAGSEDLSVAIGLYRSLGFAPIPPYRPNPVPGAMFLELALR